MKVSLASRARLGLAVASTALLAVGLAPTAAHAITTCVPVGRGPTTVGVLGQPVATTPGALVTVCVSAPTPELTGTPAVRVEPGCCGIVGLNNMTVWLDSVASPPSTVSVTVSYEIDGTGDSRTVSVPVGGTSGSSTCLFFNGDAANNPGGCVLFVED